MMETMSSPALLFEGVLYLFAGVFEVAFGLIAAAFGFKGLVVGHFADLLLDLSSSLLGRILGLVLW
jgi:hypothetical protein